MKYVKLILGGLVMVGVIGLIGMYVFENPKVAEGRKVFSYYCAPCHGSKGRGDGYNAANLDPHPRDLTDRIEPYMAEATNEDIFKAISIGVSGAVPVKGNPGEGPPPGKEEASKDDEPLGSPLMPFWGHTLTDQQIWSVVAFIRTLHKNDAPPISFEGSGEEKREESPETEKVDIPRPDSPEGKGLITRGHELFADRYACTSCHRLEGKGGQVGPELDRVGFRLQTPWVYRWIRHPQRIKPNTKMPDFAINHDDALAITLYLTTLKGDGGGEAPR